MPRLLPCCLAGLLCLTAADALSARQVPAAAPPAPTGGKQPTYLQVYLPADARLVIDGTATTQTGPLRRFASPPLAPGTIYTYTLKATWKDQGKDVVVERLVPVRAGRTAEVDLRPLPDAVAAEPPPGPPTSAPQWIKEGVELHRKDPSDPAVVEAFTQAVELDPRNARAYANRAIVRMAMGRYPQLALEDANQAVRLDPNLPLAYEARAVVQCSFNSPRAPEGDKATQAIADFSRAIALEPDQARNYLNRAVVYFLAENYARAIADCNRVIELEPGHGMAHYLRGRAHFEQGDTAKAEADDNQAFEVEPVLKQVLFTDGKRAPFLPFPRVLPRE
jgi:uncharacterized protein (TIGR03000 family)